MMKPKSGYIWLIVNPKSGPGSSKRTVRRFRDYLIRKGYVIKINITRSIGDVNKLAERAAEDRECLLVAVFGGDGTVREVARGLLGRETPMLVIPCGNENLLAGELGFDSGFSSLAEVFENGSVRRMDLGRVNDEFFTSIVGVGFDADVIERVSRNRRGHIRNANYIWPILKTIWMHNFPRLRVEVDGEVVFEGRSMAFVGNISRYAAGMSVTKHCKFDDGLLDVCIYRTPNRQLFIKHAVNTLMGQHLRSTDVIYKQGRDVRISSLDNNVRTEIDGDPGPSLPLEISVMEHSLNILAFDNDDEGITEAGLIGFAGRIL